MDAIVKKILIAEDEKPMAHALQMKLEHVGYEAVIAEDGGIALEELRKKTYDLLILDIMMPKVDGWAVLEALQKEGNKIPVIVASNLSQTEDEKRARELGAKDFIIKSNTPLAQIIESIQKII